MPVTTLAAGIAATLAGTTASAWHCRPQPKHWRPANRVGVFYYHPRGSAIGSAGASGLALCRQAAKALG